MRSDLFGIAIGMGTLLFAAAIWSLVPFWLVVLAGAVLVVWMIGVSKGESARYQRDLDEWQRQRDAAHDDDS